MHQQTTAVGVSATRPRCISCSVVGALALSALLVPANAAAQALPSGWTFTNVGGSGAAGTASFANNVFTVSGGGSGLTGRSDEFAFVHRQLTGDGLIIARLDGFQGLRPRARAGIMVRESLAAGSRYAFLDLLGSKYLELLRRTMTDGRVASIAEAVATAPIWLKLERSQSTVTASKSNDGVTWTMVGSTYVTTTSTVYVGLAVTNRSPDGPLTATFSNVLVGLPSANQPPAVSLSAPASGSKYLAPATITVSADASDPDGTVAQVSFYAGGTLLGFDTTAPYSYTWTGVAPGSYALTAVARDQGGLQTSSVPSTVDVAAPPTVNQPPLISLTAPTSGTTFAAPASITASATAIDTDGTIARVDFFAGSELIGSDTSSPYSVAWMNVPAGSYFISAVARDNAGASRATPATGITVTSNKAPTVSLTAPTSGATFTAPANITVSANAADPDGTVARVDFYAGSTLIGTDSASPYSAVWMSVPLGSYTITAVARDNVGTSTTSLAQGINVLSNLPPTVSLTAPLGGATFTAPASVTLSANATDPDGTVARVDFYAGAKLLGGDTASPYAFAWNLVPAGQYSVTAVARDNAGATTVSPTTTITINDPRIPGHALFVPSANHDTAVDRYVVDIFPSSANPSIANPVATQDVGKPPIVNGECTADISQTVTALAPGTYIATVTAVGSAGSSRSAPSLPFTR